MFSITVFSGSALPKKNGDVDGSCYVWLYKMWPQKYTCEMPEIYIFEETLDRTFFLNVCFYIFQLSLGKSLDQYLAGNNQGQENLQGKNKVI